MEELLKNLNIKIYVAGHRGMVGSAIVRELRSQGYKNIIQRSHEELDLTNQFKVNQFFKDERPDQVYLAAAKVGGIHANNTYPADFIYQNLMIQTNIIHASWNERVKRLLFLGSSCIYPKLANQPIPEKALLTAPLEPTNEPYAIAKIAGIKLCESYNRQHGTDYRSIMPTNLYGPGDSYHSENSHVIPAFIQRFHEAKISNQSEVLIWGTGKPRREFLFVDDMASASIYLMNLNKEIYESEINPMQSHINVGYGYDITILELAEIIANIIGFQGKISFDSNKPDGTLKKLIDSSFLKKLGWKPLVDLKRGLEITYQDYISHRDMIRK